MLDRLAVLLVASIAMVGIVALQASAPNREAAAADYGPSLSGSLQRFEEWTVDCTADGGPAQRLDVDVDGGTHQGGSAVKVLNPNAACVYIGSRSVNVNTAADIIGTDAACHDGKTTSIDGAPGALACTSASGAAATRVRVLSGKQ